MLETEERVFEIDQAIQRDGFSHAVRDAMRSEDDNGARYDVQEEETIVQESKALSYTSSESKTHAEHCQGACCHRGRGIPVVSQKLTSLNIYLRKGCIRRDYSSTE